MPTESESLEKRRGHCRIDKRELMSVEYPFSFIQKSLNEAGFPIDFGVWNASTTIPLSVQVNKVNSALQQLRSASLTYMETDQFIVYYWDNQDSV